jgi:hypothetical protein
MTVERTILHDTTVVDVRDGALSGLTRRSR